MQSFFERATAMAKDLQTSAVSGAQNLEGQFRQVAAWVPTESPDCMYGNPNSIEIIGGVPFELF